MPIFQDPDKYLRHTTGDSQTSDEQEEVMRRPDQPVESVEDRQNDDQKGVEEKKEEEGRINRLLSTIYDSRMETSDRVELIQRIKRGENTTWIPGATVNIDTEVLFD